MKYNLKKQIQWYCFCLSFGIVVGSGMSHDFNKKEESSIFVEESAFCDTRLFAQKLKKIISMSEEEKCLDYLKTISLTSPCEIFYPKYSDVKANLNQIAPISDCQFEFDGNIDALIRNIYDNSNSFLEQNRQFKNAFCDLDAKSENKDFEVALKTLLVDYYENSKNDINEDFCRMKSLSIVFGSETSTFPGFISNSVEKYLPSKMKKVVLAYYIPAYNVIVLNMDAIQASKSDSLLLWEEIASVLRHEINHLRQYACNCRSYDMLSPEISMERNSSSFFIESSAESELYNVWKPPMITEYKNDTNLFTYKLQRKQEAMLFLLALGRENVSFEDYYTAIFNSDFESFFSFLGATTEKDKQEICFILSSMDATLFSNNACFHYYHTKDALSYNDAKKAVGFDYKIALFRRFLIQMIKYTKTHEDFSIQSNVYLYDLVYQILTTDSAYYDQFENRIPEDEFFSKIEIMGKYYLNFLEEHYHQNIDDVYDEIRNPFATKLEEMEIYRSLISSKDEFDFPFSQPVEDLSTRFPILAPIVFASSYNVTEDELLLKVQNPQILRLIP